MKVGEPTFFFLWWRSRTAEFPSWAEFLRTILCNAPNSPQLTRPPSSVPSLNVLNGSFGDVLKNARAD